VQAEREVHAEEWAARRDRPAEKEFILCALGNARGGFPRLAGRQMEPRRSYGHRHTPRCDKTIDDAKRCRKGGGLFGFEKPISPDPPPSFEASGKQGYHLAHCPNFRASL